jgi:hypothetical protein
VLASRPNGGTARLHLCKIHMRSTNPSRSSDDWRSGIACAAAAGSGIVGEVDEALGSLVR